MRNEGRKPPYPALVGLVAVAYYAAARGALALGVLPGNIAPVWPATGIAVGALLLGGRTLWPGVFLGEVLANAGHVPVVSVLGMAAGDAVEAAAGAWLLTAAGRPRKQGRLGTLDRVADVVRFTGLAALTALLGATAGVASLRLGGVVPWSGAPDSWVTWWAGDLLGCLVVLPLALTARRRARQAPGRRLEVLLVVAAGAIALALFDAGANAPYLLLAVGAWAAVRLTPRQAAALAVASATMAVIRTAAGDGPFVRSDPTQSLLVLDAFVAVLAVTGLVIAAAVRERDLAQSQLVATNRDLAARDRRQVSELAHRALHDALTGLPNRLFLADRLTEALARRGHVAVLFVDLDRFKIVNDSRGHAAGDVLLVAAADRLRLAVRNHDTVARFGGDEFVVVCEDPSAATVARIVAARISDSFREPFVIEGQEVFLSVSVGVAVAGPDDGGSPDSLLRDADSAMYRAKESGRSRCEFFDEHMRTEAKARLETESSLHRAAEREELRLVYQPVVEIATGRIVGVEALLRWEHPQHGMLSPASFIPLAEETGLIVPMGAWALHEALRQWSGWRARAAAGGAVATPLTLAVNLSARQLRDPKLAVTVRDALERYGVGPWELCLELTESSFMADMEQHGQTLAELQALGVQLAIDDFGTGYSSLTYLQRFPVTVLKIDQSFVRGLGKEASDEAIVASVIHLAHGLGLRVVAEGVESADQLAALHRLGCFVAQGFFLGRPAPADEIDELLARCSEGVPGLFTTRRPAGNAVTPMV